MPDLDPAAKKALLAAEKQGWYLFPIRKNAKKPPLVQWREQSSNSPGRILEWAEAYPGCNWGLDCGRSGLFVLDVDGEDGLKSLTQYEIEYGPLPEPTFTVTTPRRGSHYYFYGAGKTTARVLGPGLDTRSIGGYVVFPESVVEGKRYIVQVSKKPQKAPVWLPRLLERSAPMPIPDHVDVLLDAPSSIEKARAYLEGREGATEGAGGDIWTLQTFYGLRDYGLSKEVALELFHEIFNPKCNPPWADDEAAEKARNAYKYAQNPQGINSPDADFAEANASNDFVYRVSEQDPDKPINCFDLYSQPVTERDWIVKDWIPKGEICSLYGDGGQGKSLLAIQLLASVACGTPWVGIPVEKPHKVFALFCEDNRNEVNRRLHAVVRGTGNEFNLKNAHVWCRTGKSNVLYTAMPNGEIVPSPFVNDLRKILLRDVDDHKLVILDTLADTYSGSEMNREHVGRFIKEKMKGLAQDTNSTILFLAHPSRAGMKDGDLLSGSTAWSNSVRVRLTLSTHKENPDVRILSRMKSNYSSRGETVFLTWDDGRYNSIQETSMDDGTDSPELDADAKIVLAKIFQGAESGFAYGYGSPRATNRITSITMRDAKRRIMSLDYTKKCVDYLIKMGYVENVTKNGRKALYPVGVTEQSIFSKIV